MKFFDFNTFISNADVDVISVNRENGPCNWKGSCKMLTKTMDTY